MGRLRPPSQKKNANVKRRGSRRKTKKNTVYCEENGRWYTSEAVMRRALLAAATIRGKKAVKGRKVRCIETGKWYSTINKLIGGRRYGALQRKRKDNTRHLDIIRKDACNEQRRESIRKAHATQLIKSREWCELCMGPQKSQQILKTTTEFRDGRHVVVYEDAPRKKSHGVQIDG